MKNDELFSYEAGVCNIDAVGVRRRRILGYVCLAAGIASYLIAAFNGFGPVWLCSIGFGFGFVTALNFLQVHEHFCVTNAALGTMEIVGKRLRIPDDASRALDRKKKNSMLIRAAMIALAFGALGLFAL